jgi:hypothetical protein
MEGGRGRGGRDSEREGERQDEREGGWEHLIPRASTAMLVSLFPNTKAPLRMRKRPHLTHAPPPKTHTPLGLLSTLPLEEYPRARAHASHELEYSRPWSPQPLA